MSKEIKKTLKEAREAVKSKDYNTSIKLCKWILNEDPDNYMAFVLLGAVYTDSDFKQACKYFRKAIQNSPSQTLAWQGLANCLEKQNPTEELVEAYGKLLEIEQDKYVDICQKILSVSNRLPDVRPCIKVLRNNLVVNLKSYNEISSVSLQLYGTLAQIFMNLETIPAEYADLLEEALSALTAHPEVENHTEYCRWQLKNLFIVKKIDVLWEKAKSMHTLYPQDPYPLEWICKIFVEKHLDEFYGCCCKLEIDIGDYISALKDMNKSYDMSNLAESVMLILRNNIVEARDISLKVSESRQGWLHALYALAICYHRLAAWNSCELICTRALARILPITAPLVKVHLDEMLVESLIRQEYVDKLRTAAEKCEAILSKTPTNWVIVYFNTYTKMLLEGAECHVPKGSTLNNFTDYQKLTILSLDQRLKNECESALEILTNGLKEYKFKPKEEALIYIEFGKCYKSLDKLDDSLVVFLKSARLNPLSADVFYYIAECYTLLNIEDGLERAKKCLQRSMHFDRLHPKAGSLLSRLYRQNNQLDENLALLQNAVATGRNIETKWAWLQLGLHHLSNRDYDSAINSLRVVIRIDPNDARCWESLADAYLNRGSYVSAQKSFKRALEINPTSIYAKIRIANINQNLGFLTEAVIWYNEVLRMDEHYLLALKGLGETYLLMAKQARKHKMAGLCRRYCQMAVDNLFQVIRANKQFTCLYRLFANCIMLVVVLPDVYSWLEISKDISADHDGERLYKNELFDLARKFYHQTLKISENNDNVWNELAINYHDHALYLENNNEDMGEQVLNFLNKGFSMAKKAVTLAPTKWQHWNTLGYIASNKNLNRLALAQHCFIKAINIGKDTAVAWTNLGVLYMQYGDLVLANKAFARAQESDPSYVGSWIGQSFLAHKLANDEALDLFRHSVQLAYQPECCLAYARLVCATMQDRKKMQEFRYKFAINDMQAAVLSKDILSWYLEYYGWIESDPKKLDLRHLKGKEDNIVCALLLLGYLRDHKMLYRGAHIAFETALRLCKEEQRDRILVNLAKVQLKMFQPEKALETLANVKVATYISACTLAQAYFQCARYEQCYTTYESALEWLSENDEQKTSVVICMARLAYAFQGAHETKTLLFQCLAAKPPPRHALFAACALGILHGDTTLTELILSEINTLASNNYKDADDIKKINETSLFLQIQHHLSLGEPFAARNIILKKLRLKPDCAETRLQLAEFLLCNKKAGEVAAPLIHTYLELTQKDGKRDSATKALERISRAKLQSGDTRAAKIWAQRAIFRSPDYVRTWSVLLDTQYRSKEGIWKKLHLFVKNFSSKEENKIS